MRHLARIFPTVLVVALLLAGCTDASPAGTPELVVGVSPSARDDSTPGEVLTALEGEMGASLPGVRLYAKWDDPFPSTFEPVLTEDGRVPVLSIATHREDGTIVTWREIADAAEGSPLDLEMNAWVDQLAAYGRPIYVAFSHEPTSEDRALGTPEDFVAAFRRMDEVFERAPNVRSAWVMTAWSFVQDEAGPWYPGDDVVDIVGADGFNFVECGQGDGTRWRSFEDIFGAAHDFVQEHGKPMMIAEWGSAEDLGVPGRKAEWIEHAHRLLASEEWSDVEVALYYHALGQEGRPPCAFWVDTSQGSLEAFTALADDEVFTAAHASSSSGGPSV